MLRVSTQRNPREAAALQPARLPKVSHWAQSLMCRSPPSPRVWLGSVWIRPAHRVSQVRPQSRAEDVTPGEMWVLQQEGEGNEVEVWHSMRLAGCLYTSWGQGAVREGCLAVEGLCSVDLLMMQMLWDPLVNKVRSALKIGTSKRWISLPLLSLLQRFVTVRNDGFHPLKRPLTSAYLLDIVEVSRNCR